jgi:hypothetical protein
MKKMLIDHTPINHAVLTEQLSKEEFVRMWDRAAIQRHF